MRPACVNKFWRERLCGWGRISVGGAMGDCISEDVEGLWVQPMGIEDRCSEVVLFSLLLELVDALCNARRIWEAVYCMTA